MRRLLGSLIAAALVLGGCAAADNGPATQPRADASGSDRQEKAEQPEKASPNPGRTKATKTPSPKPSRSPTPERTKSPSPPPELSTPAGVPEGAQAATVVSITDGDTLDLRATKSGALPVAAAVSVRLLEIDTPETVHPSEPVGCFGPAASAALTRLAPPGSEVWALPDVELRDQYDRYLMYLWSVQDGRTRFVNEALVRGGFARAALYEPNDRYIDLMRQAEAESRAAQTGLWGACAFFGQPLNPDPPPPPEESPSPTPPPGAGCDRESYPDVCIPPYPPDLDCDDVDATNFTVRPPDPHGFDSEPDGIGCEG